MEMTKDQARQRIFRALLLHNGDRAKAAEELDISERSLYRAFEKYSMYEILERCDWVQHKAKRGETMAMRKESREAPHRMAALQYVRKVNGTVDMGAMTKWVYGEDNADARRAMYKLVTYLVRNHMLRVDEKTAKMTPLTDGG